MVPQLFQKRNLRRLAGTPSHGIPPPCPRRTDLSCCLIRARQPPHREFDPPVGQFAPAFDTAHVGGLGITREKTAGLCPCLLTRQGEALAQIAVLRLPPCGHPVCQFARAKGHALTPRSRNSNKTTGPI